MFQLDAATWVEGHGLDFHLEQMIMWWVQLLICVSFMYGWNMAIMYNYLEISNYFYN